jgi:hypothetical protein
MDFPKIAFVFMVNLVNLQYKLRGISINSDSDGKITEAKKSMGLETLETSVPDPDT